MTDTTEMKLLVDTAQGIEDNLTTLMTSMMERKTLQRKRWAKLKTFGIKPEDLMSRQIISKIPLYLFLYSD